jgi:hypothetical protein
MGRGRAKAKQTKVARELKYNSSPNWDPNKLQSELGAKGSAPATSVDDDDEFDRYADDQYADDDESPPSRRR